MLVTGSQKTTVLKGTTFVDTLLGWGVRLNSDGSVTEDITKIAHESMFGNSGNDKLYGGAGSDKLYGEVGNDILNGGSGNDYLDGGSGIDTAVFKSSIGKNGTDKVLFKAPVEPVFFDWVNGKLTVTTSEGVDTLVNIEYLQFGNQTFNINNVPIANNDRIAAGENLLDVAASALLANDFSAKAGGNPLVIQTDFSGVVGQTNEGVNIYLGGDGRLHFADGETAYDYLAQGETLTTHFAYTVGNGSGLTDSADVTLTITGAVEEPKITFEDFEGSGIEIPDGYKGFNWDIAGDINLYVLNETNHIGSGYEYGSIDPGSMVAYTPWGDEPVYITKTDGSDFVFDSVYATAAWDASMTVDFLGFSNGVLVGSLTTSLTDTAPTFVEADWGLIDQLVINRASDGSHMVFDDFVLI